jgi:hypothetical protein
VGFWRVEVLPSPKFHDHAVGTLVEVSVNWMTCPTRGAVGLNEKFAVGGDVAVMGLISHAPGSD